MIMDEPMVDEDGFEVDVVIDPISVVNRMNTSQIFEQFINRGAELVRRRIEQMITQAPKGQEPWDQAYAYALEFITDVHKNWGDLVDEDNCGDKRAFVQEVIRDGFYLQVSPFQKGIDQDFVLKLAEKYQIGKSRITYTVTDVDGTKRRVTTKKPIMVGSEYIYLLYKMPHIRCPGVGYVNQYHTPIRSGALAKAQYPFSQTPIRLGEDEIRNIIATSGVKAAAHILGVYANSFPGVEMLANHLLFDPKPSELKQVELSLSDTINTNSIVNVTKHIFSCLGIDITPKPEDIAGLLEDQGNLKGSEVDDGQEVMSSEKGEE